MRYSEGEKGRTLQHYDLEPQIFELFLDPYMKYSSGLYLSGHESLAEAQVQKMNFVARQLELKGGEQVLDMGCGWGSLLIFLAERYGCHGWGITPAANQVEFLRNRATARQVAHLIRAEVTHIQEAHFPAEAFDAITFLGSIVHMDDKSSILRESYRLLKHKGRIYISETCFRNRKHFEEFTNRPASVFVREEVFGWGSLVPVSEIIAALEDAGFSLTGLTDLTNHYHRTIEQWMENINKNRARLEAIRPAITDKLLRLFEVANAGWGFTAKHYAVVATKKR
jgi:cyclopropane-fatty-acyl-phospholipid synthase